MTREEAILQLQSIGHYLTLFCDDSERIEEDITALAIAIEALKELDEHRHYNDLTYMQHRRACHLFGVKPRNIFSFLYWKYFIKPLRESETLWD